MAKPCKDCGVVQPETREHFGSTPSGNLRNSCRNCMRAVKKAWREANGESHNQRRGNGAIVRWGHIKRSLMAEQAFTCIYCKRDLTKCKTHIDHITPTSRGGADVRSNLQVLCVQCNLEKAAKTHTEHLVWRQRNAQHLSTKLTAASTPAERHFARHRKEN